MLYTESRVGLDALPFSAALCEENFEREKFSLENERRVESEKSSFIRSHWKSEQENELQHPMSSFLLNSLMKLLMKWK